MLSNTELATLTNKLHIPLIVQDILDGEGALTDDVRYGLHDTISDFQPDSALLAIALSARKIASIYKDASPSMDVMGLEAERLVDEYGRLWLKNASHQVLDGDEVYDTLIHTAEDLESLAELLDLNCSFLRMKDSLAASLCDILYIQARSHSLIAEEFMRVADEMVAGGETVQVSSKAPVFTDNIIPFPVTQRQS